MANIFNPANFNLMQWANAQGFLFSSTPMDIVVPMMDENGNIVNKTIHNRGMFKKQIWDDVGAALGQFNRTFYVDAQNGNDNNTGSSDQPFKTLNKAINSVPVGGRGLIHLKTSITIDNVIKFVHKDIIIRCDDNVDINFGVTTDANGYLVVNGFYFSGNLGIYKGNIITPNVNDTSNLHPTYCSTIVPNFNEYGHNASFFKGYGKTTINNIPLLNAKNWGGDINFSSVQFFAEHIVFNDSTTEIINLYSSPFTLKINLRSCKDKDGNDVDIKTRIAGIVKDSNGVPRNIISNVIF